MNNEMLGFSMDNEHVVIKKKGEDGYRVFSVRVSENIISRVDKIAAESGRSRNEVIGILLEFAVDRCRIE